MLKKMNKIALCGVLSGLLVLNSVGMVFAVDDLTPDAVITGGGIPAIAPLTFNNFGAVTLTGVTQTTTATGADTLITDASGSGLGWNVTLQATPFDLDAAGKAAAPLGTVTILPENSLALELVTIAVVDAGSTPANTIGILGGAIDNGLGVKMLLAEVNEGMGKYTVSALTLTLTLKPATTYAGTYTSTVTQTIASGPN